MILRTLQLFLSQFLLLSVTLTSTAAAEFVDECKTSVERYVFTSARFEYANDSSNRTGGSVERGHTHPSNSPDRPITGILVSPQKDVLGCTTQSYGLGLPVEWIALVQRGKCAFSKKSNASFTLGAKGIIVYENRLNYSSTVMTGIPSSMASVLLPQETGQRYLELLGEGVEVNVTLYKGQQEVLKVENTEKPSNTVLIVMACIMCPAAVLLNSASLVAMYKYQVKQKPHLYLIANLLFTDLFVAFTGSVSILVLYPKYGRPREPTVFTEVYVPCIGHVLTELWDLLLLSNLFTLLTLTVEQFIAFKWPFRHRVLVTKQRILLMVLVSWTLSSIPMMYALIKDSIFTPQSRCYDNKGFCWKVYYGIYIYQTYGWKKSLVWTLVISIALVSMILVYGYILVTVHKVKKRNPGFRKNRTAALTAICLIISFFTSYIFYYIIHFVAAVNRSYSTSLGVALENAFTNVCPACRFILDYLLTGMLGAVLDPIIYCVRTREVKAALERFFKTKIFLRRPSFTSGSGYGRGIQNSVTVDVTDEQV